MFFLLWLLDGVWKWNFRCLDSVFDSVLFLKKSLTRLIMSRLWLLVPYLNEG